MSGVLASIGLYDDSIGYSSHALLRPEARHGDLLFDDWPMSCETHGPVADKNWVSVMVSVGQASGRMNELIS